MLMGGRGGRGELARLLIHILCLSSISESRNNILYYCATRLHTFFVFSVYLHHQGNTEDNQ